MTRTGLFLACWLALPLGLAADDRDKLKVGLQPDGRIVTPTNQILQPAGKQIEFPGRPVDLLLVDGGKTLVVKNIRNLVIIDVQTAAIIQTLPLDTGKGRKGGGFSAVGMLERDGQIWVTGAQGGLHIARKTAEGKYEWEDTIELNPPAVKGSAYPTGLIWTNAGVWVAANRGNELQLVDIHKKKVTASVAVGVSPYQVVAVDNRIFVSNWGGDHPGKDGSPLTTSGTPVRIDERTNVANHGSVSLVEQVKPGEWKQTKTIPVGGHPSGMILSKDGRYLYVANANSDTVSVIETQTSLLRETIMCKPDRRLPFGSGSNALALSLDGGTLYVANGTNNCIAVVKLGSISGGPIVNGKQAPSRVVGLIPTGWYPGAIKLSHDGKKLFVANVKGHGSLAPIPENRPLKGHNSHDHLGTVSIIDIPDEATLAKMTEQVNANNRLAYSLAGLEKPRPDAKPVPMPERHGEPSVFEHVVYIIKENRTYDQVFGDIKEGKGDPKLCIFGEEVTPNHHKLVREFTLFDNYYCSGVLSADGHTWVNEAYVSDYLEKQFGTFARSYPYEGSDPLAFVPTGFLWDNALANKKSFRNYGEYVRTTYDPKGAKWEDVYADYKNGTKNVKISITPNLRSLDKYSHPTFPGFPLTTPDVYRAKMFIDEFAEMEKKGTFPNLVYIFLPADHTEGTRPGSPTPRAMVADNDLALGMVVEAISKSKFWPKTCIFVTEDDPQNGFDHIDGHRTIGMVISPYNKRKYVDSTCYNQTGMVKSIELILGLPPMTQLDLNATPMRYCFADKPDLTPYTSVKNNIPLDEMNKKLSQLNGRDLYWAKKSLELDFDKEDLADEDTLNRILWHAMKGEQKYPGDE